MPGTFRSHEHQGPRSQEEPQRIVLYLPLSVLDLAEHQAIKARGKSVQSYCETLLTQSIYEHADQEQGKDPGNERDRSERSRALLDDPDYLEEWTAAVIEQGNLPHKGQLQGGLDHDQSTSTTHLAPDMTPEQPAVAIVLRHAGLVGNDPDGLLAMLRRGDSVSPDSASELMQALYELEARYQDLPALDRRIGYALHKLSFEGQILVTEGMIGDPPDEATVEVLRLLQEAVDRILSGLDIRYYGGDSHRIPIDD